jgi:N-acetylglucosamine-6-sulfatase
MVLGIMNRLKHYGELDNTYIMYTADNGFHISQHRLPPGKACGIEEDIHIPFIMRGPNVPANKTIDVVTQHADLAPTIMKIAGADWESFGFDGTPLPLNKEEMQDAILNRQEQVNVEFWGRGVAEGKHNFTYVNGTSCKYNLLYPHSIIGLSLIDPICCR